jgi:inner membrane protein
MPFATCGRSRGGRKTSILVVLLLAVVACMDALIKVVSPPFLGLAALDEPAHLATAGLVLLMLGSRNPRFVLATLIATVAIDLDHLPAALGANFLTAGTPRPYTHSLVGIAAISLIVLAVFRRRDLFGAAALGLCIHLVRDLATGSGVALLWPFGEQGLHGPYPIYFSALVIVGLAGIGRAALSRPRSDRRRITVPVPSDAMTSAD